MSKAGYVDGFIIPISKKKTGEYKKIAKEASQVWKKFGALDYKEAIIEDDKPKYVTNTFAKMLKLKAGEAAWFSYITFKSRAHRDSVNKKVMAYFAKKYPNEAMSMPFDMKRFSYAGFKVVVQS